MRSKMLKGLRTSRRSLFTGLVALLSASSLSSSQGASVMPLDEGIPFKLAREKFAAALFHQLEGNTEVAKRCAQECLRFVKKFKTLEDMAAGEVHHLGRHTICEPDYLHTDTVLRRFKEAGIDI